MGVFVVCYERRKVDEIKRILWELARALMGPMVHSEIVFVKDLKCHTFQMNIYTPDGHPVIEKKVYDTQNPNSKYILHWCKLNISYVEECALRLRCEMVVKEKIYQMDTSILLSSALPEEFGFMFGGLWQAVFKKKYDKKETESIPIHCAGLCASVLRESIPSAFHDVPVVCTVSDLMHYLLTTNKAEVVDKPFGAYVPQWKVRDGANIKRSIHAFEDNDHYLV